MSTIQDVQKAVLAEVTKQDRGLKHVDPPGELLSTTQAKVLIEVQGGKHDLNHVANPPKGGLSEAEKKGIFRRKTGTKLICFIQYQLAMN